MPVSSTLCRVQLDEECNCSYVTHNVVSVVLLGC